MPQFGTCARQRARTCVHLRASVCLHVAIASLWLMHSCHPRLCATRACMWLLWPMWPVGPWGPHHCATDHACVGLSPMCGPCAPMYVPPVCALWARTRLCLALCASSASTHLFNKRAVLPTLAPCAPLYGPRMTHTCSDSRVCTLCCALSLSVPFFPAPPCSVSLCTRASERVRARSKTEGERETRGWGRAETLVARF